MADIIDDANATADLFLSAALLKQAQVSKVRPSGIGVCLYCGTDVDGDRRWCDVECRDEWEKERKRKA